MWAPHVNALYELKMFFAEQIWVHLSARGQAFHLKRNFTTNCCFTLICLVAAEVCKIIGWVSG